jgi:PKD repeat protein
MIGKKGNIAVFFIIIATLCACYKEVAIPIEGDFAFSTSELVAPATITIQNNIEGAEAYSWSFEGGQPAQSTQRNPVVKYSKTGTYKIVLLATNFDGQSKTIEKTITIGDSLAAKIKFTINGTAYAPVEVQFDSEIKGASSIEWTFEGGIPAKSAEAKPKVQYNIGGPHKVVLKIGNGYKTIQKDTVIGIAPELSAKFAIKKPSELFELEAPIALTLQNESAGAISFKWTMAGASPASATEKEPVITYSAPGTYKIFLETSNGKAIRTSEQEITIKPDRGFRAFENVRLGIAAAHDSLGSYFSTELGRVFRAKDVVASTSSASKIDIAFFAIDSKFSFMQFVSPQKVQDVGFEAFAGASSTKFLNNQVLLQPNAFANITVEQLAALPIIKTLEITKFIPASLPQVVLFENANGKKGAILVKKTLQAGNLSYVEVDIKVMK